MHAVPAAGDAVDERRVGQGAQHGVGLPFGHAGEAGGGRQADVGAGGDAQQGEGGALLIGEVTQRPGQHHGQAAGRVLGVQRLHTDGVEFGDGVGQRQVWLGSGAGGDQPQRQRKPAAELDQPRDRRRVGVDAVGAQGGGQQGVGLGVGEHVQLDRARTMAGDQTVQAVAAGDQDGAAAAAGQQRDDLVGRCGVVQHDQHLPVRDQTPVQLRAPVGVGGLRSRSTPSASRKPPSTSAGRAGCPVGLKPCRSANSWPSGNRSLCRCAQCTARAVLPIPPVPPIAEITTAPRPATDASAR